MFGAPAYLKRRGWPKHPDELKDHDCVVRLTDGNAEAWPFRIAGRRRLVRVSGRVRTDNRGRHHGGVLRRARTKPSIKCRNCSIESGTVG